MIVDTDILIWATRGRGSATDYLDTLPRIFISDVTYMELVQGTRDKREFRRLREVLNDMDVTTLAISAEISEKAVELVEEFAHSHSMQLADALIAATAIVHQLPLSSGNKKHFEQIPSLDLTVFRV